MGAGIAKGIAAEFPDAFKADCRTTKGDRAKLGTCSFAEVTTQHGKLTVINAYTQFDFRSRGVRADYDAIRSCMKWISKNYRDARIGLPKIGARLAGGDWETIARIIEEELRAHDFTVVEYQK